MLRFTIRDLFWLTVVMALGVAWWVERSLLISEIADRSEIDSKPFNPVSNLPNPAAPAPSLPSD